MPGVVARLTWVQAFVTLAIAARPARPRLTFCAEVAELADAHGSGPCTRKGVGVRVPSSAPVLSKSMTYRHGVHHGVHKITVLVSIVVSTSPRLFARALKRIHNPAHAAPRGQLAPRSSRSTSSKRFGPARAGALPRRARDQWPASFASAAARLKLCPFKIRCPAPAPGKQPRGSRAADYM